MPGGGKAAPGQLTALHRIHAPAGWAVLLPPFRNAKLSVLPLHHTACRPPLGALPSTGKPALVLRPPSCWARASILCCFSGRYQAQISQPLLKHGIGGEHFPHRPLGEIVQLDQGDGVIYPALHLLRLQRKVNEDQIQPSLSLCGIHQKDEIVMDQPLLWDHGLWRHSDIHNAPIPTVLDGKLRQLMHGRPIKTDGSDGVEAAMADL